MILLFFRDPDTIKRFLSFEVRSLFSLAISIIIMAPAGIYFSNGIALVVIFMINLVFFIVLMSPKVDGRLISYGPIQIYLMEYTPRISYTSISFDRTVVNNVSLYIQILDVRNKSIFYKTNVFKSLGIKKPKVGLFKY